MALVMPILIALIIGIAEYGRAWFLQGALGNAAREGVRYVALHKDIPGARAVAVASAPGIGLAAGDVAATTDCTTASPEYVTVTVTHTFTSITGFFGTTFILRGTGTMRCGG